MCFFFFQAEDGIRDKLVTGVQTCAIPICGAVLAPHPEEVLEAARRHEDHPGAAPLEQGVGGDRSEEHTSELQSLAYLVCRLLLEKKKTTNFMSRVTVQAQAERAAQ